MNLFRDVIVDKRPLPCLSNLSGRHHIDKQQIGFDHAGAVQHQIGNAPATLMGAKKEAAWTIVIAEEIVPEDEKLIIEARLPLSEIGYISVGLEAKIKLNTPEGSRFRPLSGEVTFVGADKVSNSKEKDEDYYLVKIETNEKSSMKQNESFKLYSGVPVIIGIITGKRSFIEYFVSPFKSKFSFALSER